MALESLIPGGIHWTSCRSKVYSVLVILGRVREQWGINFFMRLSAIGKRPPAQHFFCRPWLSLGLSMVVGKALTMNVKNHRRYHRYHLSACGSSCRGTGQRRGSCLSGGTRVVGAQGSQFDFVQRRVRCPFDWGQVFSELEALRESNGRSAAGRRKLFSLASGLRGHASWFFS